LKKKKVASRFQRSAPIRINSILKQQSKDLAQRMSNSMNPSALVELIEKTGLYKKTEEV
jgi:hypothetical protein